MRSLWKIACGFAAVGTMVVVAPSVSSAQNFGVCPNVGDNSAGCALLITVGSGGTLTFNLNPTNSGPYDGSDDALVGVVNSSGAPLSSLFLDGGPTDIFGFEGDGVCSNSYYTGCSDTSPFGPTGYEGPNNTFSGINGSSTSGTVNFTTALADGGNAWFTLEETPQSIVTGGITGGGTTGGVTTTPEPGSLALLGTGLVALVPVVRRRVRK